MNISKCCCPAERVGNAGFPQTVIAAGEKNQFHMMGQVSDQCCGHTLIVQDIDSLRELNIRIQDNGFDFMYRREIVKEELRAVSIIGNLTKLIEDQDFSSVKLLFQSLQASFLSAL